MGLKNLKKAIADLKNRSKNWGPKKLIADKNVKTSIGTALLVMFLLLFFGFLAVEKEELPRRSPQPGGVPEIKATPAVKADIGKKKRIKQRPKIALILDDAGGNIPDYYSIFSLKQPITISIIPFLPSSQKLAKDAAYRGFEVMLHIPMEPEDERFLGSNKRMITTSMGDYQIKRQVLDSISNVKYAVGINNHMGSKATKDRRVMCDIMSVLRGRPMYFIDSGTSNGSIAYRTAQEYKVLTARNNVFLDGGTDRSSIESKFRDLVRSAKSNGSAIGIGHATRKVTIDALKDLIPEYSNMGIEFVYVSELVK